MHRYGNVKISSLNCFCVCRFGTSRVCHLVSPMFNFECQAGLQKKFMGVVHLGDICQHGSIFVCPTRKVKFGEFILCDCCWGMQTDRSTEKNVFPFTFLLRISPASCSTWQT